jgi:putative transposase
LGVKVQHCWPYHGQSKPIERFFGTVENDTRVWPTYCGNSTANKPVDLQLQLERGNAPSMKEFAERFDAWIGTFNATGSNAQGLDGKSPDRVFAQSLATKRTATPEMLDALCLARTKPVKVMQNGVMYSGMRFGQYDLVRHVGQEVVLAVDERDLGQVPVWSLDGKFLAIAHVNKKLPFKATTQELREALGEKRKARKAMQDITSIVRACTKTCRT